MSPEEHRSWLLVIIATCASILGSSLIYVDLVWNYFSRYNFSILHSSSFIGSALSLSGGTLLVTALYSLLPTSRKYITDTGASVQHANIAIFGWFSVGIVVCLIFNTLVHYLTSRSVVRCAHSLDEGFKPNERSPLLHEHACPDPHHVHHAPDADDPHLSAPSAPQVPVPNNSNAGLLSIGLQTAAGIAVHRIPEGFLLFATSRADRSLGLSLVLSLSIHSFSEGFTIATPLYGALGSRYAALAIAVTLGGGSQPLGALLAALWMSDHDLQPSAYYNFGVAMAATAGFMMTIATQMLGTAVVYERSQRRVTVLTLIGALLVLGTKCL